MMEKLEIVTELRLRREAVENPKLRLRKNVVAKLQLCCQAQTSLDERRLLSWETREHEPCELHANALCAYFQVALIAELGLGHGDEAAYNWTWGTKAERKAEVHRRLLMAKGVKVLAPALLPVGPLVALGQRLGGRPSLDLGDVQAAEQVATHLAIEYLAAPNAETVRAAIAHTRTLTDRLKLDSLTPEVRSRLAAVACDAASLASYATLHAGGRRVEANLWCDDAIRLAREAGDRRLEALALGMSAFTLSESPAPGLGQGDRSHSLAAREAASALDRHLPAYGRAYANGLFALELAAAGDDAGSGRAMERALNATAVIGREEPGWGWWSQHAELSGWDAARARMYTGVRALFLGRHRDAVPLLQGALDDTTVPIRRAYARLDLTQTWHGLGDPDRASAAGIAALDEADGLKLGSAKNELRLIRNGFPEEWNDLACMCELDERLALA